MEQININAEAFNYQFKELVVETEKTVKDLLVEMNLSGLAMAVIVDGVKADDDTVIKEGQKVVILPRIAGGMGLKSVVVKYLADLAGSLSCEEADVLLDAMEMVKKHPDLGFTV